MYYVLGTVLLGFHQYLAIYILSACQLQKKYVRFVVFMVVNNQIEIFWVMVPCSAATLNSIKTQMTQKN
jgi:hypothetical protein